MCISTVTPRKKKGYHKKLNSLYKLNQDPLLTFSDKTQVSICKSSPKQNNTKLNTIARTVTSGI